MQLSESPPLPPPLETHRNLNDLINNFHHQLCTSTTSAVVTTTGSSSPPLTSTGNSGPTRSGCLLIEPDPNSFCSDYSEMGEPIREHLANVQIIVREDLDMGNTSAPAPSDPAAQPRAAADPPLLEREADESEEEYTRRVRKTNYLSLAQEFAALKRLNADALPFDLHQHHQQPVESDRLGGTEDDEDEDEEEEEGSSGDGGGRSSFTAEEMSLGSVGCRRSSSPSSPTGCPSVDDGGIGGTVPDVIPDPHRSNALSDGSPHSCHHQQHLSTVSTIDVPDCSKGLTTAKTAAESTASLSGACVTAAAARRKAAEEAAAACIEEFDVYTIESALQSVEWQKLMDTSSNSSHPLQLGTDESTDHRKRWSRCGDRDEIRRRLAMSADDDVCAGSSGGRVGGGLDSTLQRKSQPTFHTTRLLHSTTSLQVCYLNDDAANFDSGELAGSSGGTPDVTSCAKPDIIPKSISEASSLSAVHGKVGSVGQTMSIHEDFFTKQARLQAEAKLALAQVRPMAHMQLQLEKEMRKKSPLSEMVVSIPGFVDGKMRQLSRQLLQRMNIAQLQVVVNDLHTQIEALNADLMQQLVDRDDLHMAQDSMLVDIDDLTRRAQEFAAKVNKQGLAVDFCHHK